MRRITPKCAAWRDPSPRLSAGATQLRKNVETVQAVGADLTCPGIEPQTSRTNRVRVATATVALSLTILFPFLLLVYSSPVSVKRFTLRGVCFHSNVAHLPSDEDFLQFL